MTDLKIRRIKFELEDDVPFLWNPDFPRACLELNGGFTFQGVAFEQYVMWILRDAMQRIDDPAVKEEARAFMAQEGHHANQHQRHADALIRRYPGLADTIPKLLEGYRELYESNSLEFNLAYITNLEACFTPAMKLIIDHRDRVLAGGDARIASLMLWHFIEEIEHRSSAFIVYDALVGSPWYRLAQVPAVAHHTYAKLRKIWIGEFEKHIPHEELYGTPEQQRNSQTLPKWDMLVTAGRLLGAQTPWHDPAHAELPPFVEQWHERDRRGESMTRVYGVGATA